MKTVELNNTIEEAILKLKLSPNSPMTFPEQEELIKEQIEKYHNQIKQSTGIEKTLAVDTYVLILELHWNLIKNLIDIFKAPVTKSEDFLKEYKLKAIEFLNTNLTSSIHDLKSIYLNSDSETKAEIGKSLVRLYPIYIEAAIYYFRFNSGEHMALYTKSLKDLEEMKIVS